MFTIANCMQYHKDNQFLYVLYRSGLTFNRLNIAYEDCHLLAMYFTDNPGTASIYLVVFKPIGQMSEIG